MSIRDILEKIKPFYGLFMVIVVGAIFFALGRLWSLEERHSPIKIQYTNSTSTASVISSEESVSTSVVDENVPTDGPVIGSKSGKKYYFPWCGTVKRIKPENQVHFASIEEAKKAGFTPGGNCKGLQ